MQIIELNERERYVKGKRQGDNNVSREGNILIIERK